MPEGHTVHALAERLEGAFGGQLVAASSPQGRFAADAGLLDGRVLERARAWGKHLFVSFGDLTLHVHLGLIGMFHVKPHAGSGPPAPLGAIRLRLVGPSHWADLRGPMICALVDRDRQWEVVRALGPDPLRRDRDPEIGLERVRRSRRTVAELLMEQSVLAGVGNVYRCEVLHRRGIDPLARGVDLSDELWREIWDDLVLLMPLGQAFGQILTVPEQVEEAIRLRRSGRARMISRQLTGERLGDTFERRFLVYQRAGERCSRCTGTIQQLDLGGRRLYWCPGCQLRR